MMEWFFAAALSLVSVIGMTGNIFTIYVAVKEKLFKRIIWSYLLSLTFSDIFSFTVTCPVTITAFYDESVLQRRSICNLQGSAMNFLMGWSLITIGFVNTCKYRCIKSPLIDRVKGKSWWIVFIGVILSVSGFVAVAPIIGLSRYIHQKGRKWCVVQTKGKYRSLLFVLVAAFISLSVLVVFCNIATAQRVRKEMQTYAQRYSMNRQMEQIFNRRRYKIFQTTLIVTIMFHISWAPLFTMIVIEAFGREVPLLYAKISYFSALAQGCVNPVIYCFGHYAFKKQFKRRGRYMERNANRNISETKRRVTRGQQLAATNI